MIPKILTLVRGLPGSGKSTFANTITNEFSVCEADKFFYDKEGNYNFDRTKISQAHKWCKEQVEIRMKDNQINEQFYPHIAVSNTFTKEWEMSEYFELAKQYEYQVFTIIVENRHGGVNQHGVPTDKIQQMKDRFEVKL
jgi:predicted kinase